MSFRENYADQGGIVKLQTSYTFPNWVTSIRSFQSPTDLVIQKGTCNVTKLCD